MTKKIKILKDFTYFSLVKEAIFSTSMLEATAKDIYGYFIMKYPTVFRLSNSFTWKSGIRQTLCKYPEFVKIRKVDGSREYLWTYRPMREIEKGEDSVTMLLRQGKDLLGVWEVINRNKIEKIVKKYPHAFMESLLSWGDDGCNNTDEKTPANEEEQPFEKMAESENTANSIITTNKNTANSIITTNKNTANNMKERSMDEVLK